MQRKPNEYLLVIDPSLYVTPSSDLSYGLLSFMRSRYIIILDFLNQHALNLFNWSSE